LEPTLIANRSQLAQLARVAGRTDDILQPWQSKLLQDDPQWAEAARA
jgi:ribonuclease D